MTMMLEVDEQKVLTFEGFQEDPFLTRHSYLLREIQIYAPKNDPSEWKDLPFLLCSTRGFDSPDAPGLRIYLNAHSITEALKHVAVIGEREIYSGPIEAEEYVSDLG